MAGKPWCALVRPRIGGVPIDANDPRSKQQQIADDLRALAVTGVLAAGERLPSTRELMTRYGVSSQTVQSALRILQDAGVSQGVPGRGTFVRSDFDPASITHDGGPADPSPDYLALRQELQQLATQVRTIHDRLDELQAQVDEVRSPEEI